MKAMVIIVMLIISSSLSELYAQPQSNLKIKVLPSAPGRLKVLYAMHVSEPVTITFFNSVGILKADRVCGPFEKGFLKWYDVQGISDDSYWIKVKSADLTITYRIEWTKDKREFSTHLEEIELHSPA